MKIMIEQVEEMIERKVCGYSTSTRISVPRRWANRRVKIILVKE